MQSNKHVPKYVGDEELTLKSKREGEIRFLVWQITTKPASDGKQEQDLALRADCSKRENADKIKSHLEKMDAWHNKKGVAYYVEDVLGDHLFAYSSLSVSLGGTLEALFDEVMDDADKQHKKWLDFRNKCSDRTTEEVQPGHLLPKCPKYGRCGEGYCLEYQANSKKEKMQSSGGSK